MSYSKQTDWLFILLFVATVCSASTIPCLSLFEIRNTQCHNQPAEFVVSSCVGNVTCNQICKGISRQCVQNVNGTANGICTIPINSTCIIPETNFQDAVFCDPMFSYYFSGASFNSASCSSNSNKAATLADLFFNQTLYNPVSYTALPADYCDYPFTYTTPTGLNEKVIFSCTIKNLTSPYGVSPPFTELNKSIIYSQLSASGFPSSSSTQVYELSLTVENNLAGFNFNNFRTKPVALDLTNQAIPWSCLNELSSIYISGNFSALLNSQTFFSKPSIQKINLQQIVVNNYYDVFGVVSFQNGTTNVFANRTQIVMNNNADYVGSYDIGDLLTESMVNVDVIDYLAVWTIGNFFSKMSDNATLYYSQTNFFLGDNSVPSYPNLEYFQLTVNNPGLLKRTPGTDFYGDFNDVKFAFNLPKLKVFVLNGPLQLTGVIDSAFFCALEYCSITNYVDNGLSDPNNCCNIGPSTCVEDATTIPELAQCDVVFWSEASNTQPTSEECAASPSNVQNILNLISFELSGYFNYYNNPTPFCMEVMVFQGIESVAIPSCELGYFATTYQSLYYGSFYYNVSYNPSQIFSQSYSNYLSIQNNNALVFELAITYNALHDSLVYTSPWITNTYGSITYSYAFPSDFYAYCLTHMAVLILVGINNYFSTLKVLLQQAPVLQKVIMLNSMIDSYNDVFGTSANVVANRTEVIANNCILYDEYILGLNNTPAYIQKLVNITDLFAPSIINFLLIDNNAIVSVYGFGNSKIPNLKYFGLKSAYGNNDILVMDSIDWQNKFPSLEVFILDGPYSLSGTLNQSFFCALEYCNITIQTSYELQDPGNCCDISYETLFETPTELCSEPFVGQISGYLNSYCQLNPLNASIENQVSLSPPLSDRSASDIYTLLSSNNELVPDPSNPSLYEIFFYLNNTNEKPLPGDNGVCNHLFCFPPITYSLIIPDQLPFSIESATKLTSVFIDGGDNTWIYGFWNLITPNSTIQRITIKNAELQSYYDVLGYLVPYPGATPVLTEGQQLTELILVNNYGVLAEGQHTEVGYLLSSSMVNFALTDTEDLFSLDYFASQIQYGNSVPAFPNLKYFQLNGSTIGYGSHVFDFSTVDFAFNFPSLEVFVLEYGQPLQGIINTEFFCALKTCIIVPLVNTGLFDPGDCCVTYDSAQCNKYIEINDVATGFLHCDLYDLSNPIVIPFTPEYALPNQSLEQVYLLLTSTNSLPKNNDTELYEIIINFNNQTNDNWDTVISSFNPEYAGDGDMIYDGITTNPSGASEFDRSLFAIASAYNLGTNFNTAIYLSNLVINGKFNYLYHSNYILQHNWQRVVAVNAIVDSYQYIMGYSTSYQRTEVIVHDCISVADYQTNTLDLGNILLPNIFYFYFLDKYQTSDITAFFSTSNTNVYSTQYLYYNVSSYGGSTTLPNNINNIQWATQFANLTTLVLVGPFPLVGNLSDAYFCSLEVCVLSGFVDYGVENSNGCCVISNTTQAGCVESATTFQELVQCDYLTPFYTNDEPAEYDFSQCQASPTYAGTIQMLVFGNISGTSEYASLFSSPDICSDVFSSTGQLISLVPACTYNQLFSVNGIEDLSFITPSQMYPSFNINSNTFTFYGMILNVQYQYFYINNWYEINEQYGYLPDVFDYTYGFLPQFDCITTFIYLEITAPNVYIPDSLGIFNVSSLQNVNLNGILVDNLQTAAGTAEGMVENSRTVLSFTNCAESGDVQGYASPNQLDIVGLLNPALLILRIASPGGRISLSNFISQMSFDSDSEPLFPSLLYFELEIPSTFDSSILDFSTLNWAYHFPQLETFIFHGYYPLQSGYIPDSFFGNLQYCNITSAVGHLASSGGYCGLPTIYSCELSAQNFYELVQCDYMYPFYSNSNPNYNETACQTSATYAATLGVAAYTSVGDDYTFGQLSTTICETSYSNYIYDTMYVTCNINNVYTIEGTTLSASLPQSFTETSNNIIFAGLYDNFGSAIDNGFNNVVGLVFTFDNIEEVTNWNQVFGPGNDYDYYGNVNIALGMYYSLKPQMNCITSLASIVIDGSFTYLPDDYGYFNASSLENVNIKNLEINDFRTPFGTAPGMNPSQRTEVIMINCILAPPQFHIPVDISEWFTTSLVNVAVIDSSFYTFAFTGFFNYFSNTDGAPLQPNLSYLLLTFSKVSETTPFDINSIAWAYNFPALQTLYIDGPITLNGLLDYTYFSGLASCTITNNHGTIYSPQGLCGLPTSEPNCVQASANLQELVNCDYLAPFYHMNVEADYDPSQCTQSPPFAASFMYALYLNIDEPSFVTDSANLCAQSYNPNSYVSVTAVCNIAYVQPNYIFSPPLVPVPYPELYPQIASYSGYSPSTSPLGLIYTLSNSLGLSDWGSVFEFENHYDPSQLPNTNSGFGLQTNCIASLGSIGVVGGYAYIPDSYGILNSAYIQSVIMLNTEFDSYDYVFGIQNGMVPGIQRTQVLLHNCQISGSPDGGAIDITTYLLYSLYVLGIWQYNIPFTFATFFSEYIFEQDASPLPNMVYLVLEFDTIAETTVYDISTIDWTTYFPSLQVFALVGPVYLTGYIDDSYFQNLQSCTFSGYNGAIGSAQGLCGLPKCIYTYTPREGVTVTTSCTIDPLESVDTDLGLSEYFTPSSISTIYTILSGGYDVPGSFSDQIYEISIVAENQLSLTSWDYWVERYYGYNEIEFNTYSGFNLPFEIQDLPYLSSMTIDGGYSYFVGLYGILTTPNLQRLVVQNLRLNPFQYDFFYSPRTEVFLINNFILSGEVDLGSMFNPNLVNLGLLEPYLPVSIDQFVTTASNTDGNALGPSIQYIELEIGSPLTTTPNDLSNVYWQFHFPNLQVFILNGPFSLTGTIDGSFLSGIEYCNIAGYTGTLYCSNGCCGLLAPPPPPPPPCTETATTLGELAQCDVMYPCFQGEACEYPTPAQCQASLTQAASFVAIGYAFDPYNTVFSLSGSPNFCQVPYSPFGTAGTLMMGCGLGYFTELLRGNSVYGAYDFPIIDYSQLYSVSYANVLSQGTSDYLMYELVITTNNAVFSNPTSPTLNSFNTWDLSGNSVTKYGMPTNLAASCLPDLAFLFIQGNVDYYFMLSRLIRRAPVLQKITIVQAVIESYQIIFGTFENSVFGRTEVIAYDCVLYNSNLINPNTGTGYNSVDDGSGTYQEGYNSYNPNLYDASSYYNAFDDNNGNDYPPFGYQYDTIEGQRVVFMVDLLNPALVNCLLVDFHQYGSLVYLPQITSDQAYSSLKYLTINFSYADSYNVDVSTINWAQTFPALNTLSITGPFNFNGTLTDIQFFCVNLVTCVFSNYIDNGFIDATGCCNLIPNDG